MVVNADTFEMTPIRVSDGVLLAVSGNIPIYIDERLMMQQSVPYRMTSEMMSVPLPINTMSMEMIDKAIERAIKDENYEQASMLTEEKKRRKGKMDN